MKSILQVTHGIVSAHIPLLTHKSSMKSVLQLKHGIVSAHIPLLTQKSLTRTESLSTRESSTQLVLQLTQGIVSAYILLLTQKSLTKTKSLSTKKSTQSMSLPIQKSSATIKSFLVSTFPLAKHKVYTRLSPYICKPHIEIYRKQKCFNTYRVNSKQVNKIWSQIFYESMGIKTKKCLRTKMFKGKDEG